MHHSVVARRRWMLKTCPNAALRRAGKGALESLEVVERLGGC